MKETYSATEGEGIFRLIPAVYLIHLLVPLFFSLDVLLALRHEPVGRADIVVLLVCGAWFTAGLLAFLLYGKRKRFLHKATGPLLAFYAVFLTLGVTEAGLRLAGDERPRTIWKPGVNVVREGEPRGLPGVSGPAKFTVNELGLRGPTLPAGKGIYKIITVGGSTTECFVLDDTKEWSHLLMEGLNARQKDVPVWVANSGVSGHTAVHHLTLLRSLPILSQVNLLIFSPGVNDLQATWSFEGAATQRPLQRDADEFLHKIGIDEVKPFPLYKRLRLYKMVRSAIALPSQFAVREDTQKPTWFDHRRALRAAGPPVSAPDLHIGLEEYGARIRAIARECSVRGLRCLFLTQPSVWRENLTPEEQKLLWFGWVGPIHGPKGFVSISDAANGMEAFNGVLEKTCVQSNLECLDLATLVPKEASIFFDDVHLNENGARIVAEALVHYLFSTAPFSKTTAQREPEASKDHASGSPDRVPNSRLAAAQAVIEEKTYKPAKRKKSAKL